MFIENVSSCLKLYISYLFNSVVTCLFELQISLEELRRATNGPNAADLSSPVNGSSVVQSGASHYDRQLERISQMLKESNDELRKTEKKQSNHTSSIFGGRLFCIIIYHIQLYKYRSIYTCIDYRCWQPLYSNNKTNY